MTETSKEYFLSYSKIFKSFFKSIRKKLLISISYFCACYSTMACASTKYPISDHFDGQHFFIKEAPPVKGFWDLLKWQLSGGKKKWPEWVDDNEVPQIQTHVLPGQVWVTSINHASHLIQLPRLNILTDPIFSKRASPLSWIGPHRVRAPGISLQNLPKIDVVMISHNHYDHLDLDSLIKMNERDQPLFLVGLGQAELLLDSGIKNVQELDWWQAAELSDNRGEIIFTPVHHWCARGMFDRNKALWGGFVVMASNLKIYFAGDTGYGHFFKETREKLGNMDVSILPIGAYEPRWFMKEQHMNPEDAVQAHLDIQSRWSIGTHFGTFQLTDEGIDDPINDLEIAKQKYEIKSEVFQAPKNGKTLHFVKE